MTSEAVLFFAGPRGIEPRPTDLEAVVLPLNYRPVCEHSSIYHELLEGKSFIDFLLTSN